MEGILNKNLHTEKKKSWRLFWADLFSRVTFSIASGLVIELFVANMTFVQMVISRAIAQPIVAMTARPYGIYRDWALRKMNVHLDEKGKPLSGKKGTYIITNMVTYATFFCPQYALKLWIIGATTPQILKATIFVAITSPILGPINGRWMDLMRIRVFKVPPDEYPEQQRSAISKP